MLAHTTENGRQQTLKEHCTAVSNLCAAAAHELHLDHLAQLIGLLHDFGKGTADFQAYLNGVNIHPNHSAGGALYAYKHWLKTADNDLKQMVQMIALCICGHHTGLHDCIRADGSSAFLEYMAQEDTALYQEAEQNFLNEVATQQEIDELFHLACEEYRNLPKDCKESYFFLGFLSRLLLSILIDADRWDSACFEYRKSPFEQLRLPDWTELNHRLEHFSAEHFTGTDRLSLIRKSISDTCAKEAVSHPGIFRLSVPTGGGKTLSSLRYALIHAGINHHQRIFYIIPFNTILDQNAKDIRSALDDYPSILEHHSNVVFEDDNNGEKQTAHKRLTERWDSDIILTSMVQFLNACYSGKNSDARRLHRLSNAVLIFDEIQSLPKHCKTLFEQAVQFLTQVCGSTVVLCTATQPTLEVVSRELMPNVASLYHDLKRVQYIPQLSPPKSCMDAAQELAHLIHRKNAVLMIANTKAAAWNLFDNTRQLLIDSGYQPVETPSGLCDEEIRSFARSSTQKDILCVHLSTLMCAAHRQELLRWVRIWTKERKNILCVSTALIEAGINVSFPVVVRSLAGLPSIIQAGGRCNRNMEWNCGEVYIWKMDPDVEHLPAALSDISDGQVSSQKILSFYRQPDALNQPNTIQEYFIDFNQKNKDSVNYPCGGTTLVEMLGFNTKYLLTARFAHPELFSSNKLFLPQAFRTAGDAFKVIDQNTRSVLVPYGKGAALLAELEGSLSMEERFSLLRKAQAYSVNLFDHVYRRLDEAGALRRLEESDVVVLDSRYYEQDGGVCTEPRELEEIIF